MGDAGRTSAQATDRLRRPKWHVALVDPDRFPSLTGGCVILDEAQFPIRMSLKELTGQARQMTRR